MSEKSPAFQFYPSDFLSDKNVAVMTAAEVGAYWLLISYCWQSGGLKDDVEYLAQLARVPVSRFRKMWELKIKTCFIKTDVDNILDHPRLQREREKQNEWRAKSARGGQKSAISRKGGSSLVQPKVNQGGKGGSGVVQPKVNTSSSSSSSDKDKIKGTAVHTREVMESDFEDIWKQYPNRQGKKNAYRHFFATVKTGDDLHRIRSALQNYLGSGNVARGFIKQGSTWFNEWQDWAEPTEVMMKGNGGNAINSAGGAKHSGSKAGGATTGDDLTASLAGLEAIRSRGGETITGGSPDRDRGG